MNRRLRELEAQRLVLEVEAEQAAARLREVEWEMFEIRRGRRPPGPPVSFAAANAILRDAYGPFLARLDAENRDAEERGKVPASWPWGAPIREWNRGD